MDRCYPGPRLIAYHTETALLSLEVEDVSQLSWFPSLPCGMDDSLRVQGLMLKRCGLQLAWAFV